MDTLVLPVSEWWESNMLQHNMGNENIQIMEIQLGQNIAEI